MSPMQSSLSALKLRTFYSLANDFPILSFRMGALILQRGGIAVCDAVVYTGKLRLVFEICSCRVVFTPCDSVENVRQRVDSFFRCFTAVCNCENKGHCEHQAAAMQALWYALQHQDGKITTADGLRGVKRTQDGLRKAERLELRLSSNKKKEEPELFVTLRAIFICMDANLAGAERIWGSPDTATISISTAVKNEDFSHHVSEAKQHSLLNDIFAVSPLQESWRTRTYIIPEIEVQYQFSDGTVLDLHEIQYHKFGSLLPMSLLPIRFCGGNEQDREGIDDLGDDIVNFGPHMIHQNQWYSGDLEAAMLRIIYHAAKLSTPLHLVCGRNTDGMRLALPLSQTVFLDGTHNEENPPWHLSCSLQPEQHYNNVSDADTEDLGFASLKSVLIGDVAHEALAVFLNFAVDVVGKRLIFHRCAGLFRQLQTDLESNGVEYITGVSKNPLPLPACLAAKEVYGHEWIHSLRQRLAARAKTDPNWEFNETPHVSELINVAPKITIGQDGKLRFIVCGQTPSGHHITIMNFPIKALQFLDHLMHGWNSFLEEGMDVAARAPLSRRKQELKVLGHLGGFTFAVQKIISTTLGQPPLTRKQRDQLKNDVLAHLDQLIMPLPIGKARGFISQCMDRMIQMCDTSGRASICVQTHFGAVLCQPYFQTFLRLVLKLIEVQIAKTSGACFSKQRVPVLTCALTHDKEAGEDSVLSVYYGEDGSVIDLSSGLQFKDIDCDRLLAALLPLQQFGCEILFAGKSVTSLSANTFRAQFILGESTEVESGAIDWFDLSPKFFIHDTEIPAESAMELARGGVVLWEGSYYRIDAATIPLWRHLERFWERLTGGQTKGPNKKGELGYLRLPRSAALELLHLRAADLAIEGGGEAWREIVEYFDQMDKPREAPILPESVKADLKPYQCTGVGWLMDLYRLRLGGILADDMGLGKTLQALTFLEILRTRSEMGHVLIVVPTSLTYNWMAERDRFLPAMPMLVFNSKDRSAARLFMTENPHAVIVCTYGLLIEHTHFFSENRWNIHIYDEAQNLKNIGSQRCSVVRGLQATRKFCLTGTPLENHLGEFFSLMDLVVPGCLGELTAFRDRYTIRERVADADNMAYLRLQIRPLVLRRTKTEILLDLPKKQESTVVLPFETIQRGLYRDVALSWNTKVGAAIREEGEGKSQLLMLTALLRLRQACSDPAVLPGVTYELEPPKVELLADAIEQIIESGESALVFTQFLGTFERIQKRLQKDGVTCFAIHGGISRVQREKVLSEFNSHKTGAVLLMTLKTGGTGLNLTKASYVFHIEPWWNPAVENQASDRAHRMGQTRSVQVYRYLMEDSVEQKIESLKRRKAAHFDLLFGNVEDENHLSVGSGNISRSDFEYLLSAGPTKMNKKDHFSKSTYSR